MKEIFDKRYPVTSFFLLVTALVFLLMLVLTGLNFERADTLLQFGAMYGPIIRLFPEQIWRLFFGYICTYRLGTFHCQYDFTLLSWTTGGGDFRF